MKYGRWAMGFVSLILGFMIVTQYHMAQHKADDNLRLQRAGDLALQLQDVKAERDALAQQLATIKEEGTVDGVREENEQLRLQAGLTDVEGRGLLVTIDDSAKPVVKGENPNLYLIHDEDILRVVNELRAGGAEAISINEQRLLGTSEIRCSGPTVTVNGRVLGAPFVIKAIGDSKTLNSALTIRGGVVDSLKHWGIKVDIQEEEYIRIPAFEGNFHNEYLKVSQGGGQS